MKRGIPLHITCLEHVLLQRIFCLRGRLTICAKKFSQVAQIFTKQSERNEGYTLQQHRPTIVHMKRKIYSYS